MIYLGHTVHHPQRKLNMSDPTETIRREMVAEINSVVNTRADLEAKYGQVWTTQEMQVDFSVDGFLAPFVVVTNNATGKKGTLTFSHSPRFYYDFTES